MTVKFGSEKSITPEDRWISKFSNWDLIPLKRTYFSKHFCYCFDLILV